MVVYEGCGMHQWQSGVDFSQCEYHDQKVGRNLWKGVFDVKFGKERIQVFVCERVLWKKCVLGMGQTF